MIYETFKQALQTQQLVTLVTIVSGPNLGSKLLVWPDGRQQGSLGLPELEHLAHTQALAFMTQQQSGRATFTLSNETTADLFFDVQIPQPKLVMVGAVHIAIPLVTFANTLGFHTVVVDARTMFATPERFAHADELITQWPDEALEAMSIDEATYIVTLTHDEKLDNPALKVAVGSKARYIGALGARSTHAKRVKALQTMGVTDEQIARIHAPIGLNIGARGPEEIAVSIIAEIVAARRGSKLLS